VHRIGFGSERFTEDQIAAPENLLFELPKKFNIDPENIVGDKDLEGVPAGRIDPGPKLELKHIKATVKSRLNQ